MKSIAILGEFDPRNATHVATNDSIAHSSSALRLDADFEWIATDRLDESLFERADAILVAPGSPYKDMERTLDAIRTARERGVPCLGTCGGFQHMVLEYARNVLGFRDAHHAEYDPFASDLFLTRLACSLVGREMSLTFAPGSRVAEIYGRTSAVESYYCNFGVNPEKVALLASADLRVSGSDAEGEVRVVELPTHPFFIGTLFIPQTRSRPGAPHPLVTAFVEAATTIRHEGAGSSALDTSES